MELNWSRAGRHKWVVEVCVDKRHIGHLGNGAIHRVASAVIGHFERKTFRTHTDGGCVPGLELSQRIQHQSPHGAGHYVLQVCALRVDHHRLCIRSCYGFAKVT